MRTAVRTNDKDSAFWLKTLMDQNWQQENNSARAGRKKEKKMYADRAVPWIMFVELKSCVNKYNYRKMRGEEEE